MIQNILIQPRMNIFSLANDDFYGHGVFKQFPAHDNIRLISINGSTENFLTDAQMEHLREKYGFTTINAYRFDDIGGDIWESIVNRENIDRSTFIEFSDELAQLIKSNIDGISDPSNELLVVHCHAGISRSGAIGSAIAYYLGLDSIAFKDLNPNIDPNKFILEKMLKALGLNLFGFNYWRNKNNRLY